MVPYHEQIRIKQQMGYRERKAGTERETMNRRADSNKRTMIITRSN